MEAVNDPQRLPPPGGSATFFAEHGEMLLRVATSIVGKVTFLGVSAEDIVSDTMRKLLVAGIPEGANPKAYAITAVKNTARDLTKKKKQYTDEEIDFDTEIGVDNIEDAIDDALLAEDLRDALDELPEREAHAIREKIMKDRHWSEVGPEIDVTTSQGLGKVVNRGLDTIRSMPRFADLGSGVSPPRQPSTTTDTSPGATP